MSDEREPRFTNRLAAETSPYLLQHAHNPVDWYPWGPEALEKARTEDKPILLSIGYSACHWCHVMERESFEDEPTAALMNDRFVSIKVDREERPDLDAIYMQAVQAMTGSGGWPMTVFLSPDGNPFYGGTYFPPEDRGGMPGFSRLLLSLAQAWRERRSDVQEHGQQLRDYLQQALQPKASEGALSAEMLDEAAVGMLSQFDGVEGGFGRAPKFPQPMAIEFLFRQWKRTGDDRSLRAATLTLDSMARGGMYDQLGGGFHRYSVDGSWLVPHFEKMLYDNAQLSRAFLMGYQATGREDFRQVAEEMLDYVLRDMADPSGGIYSTEDADSEGEEGRFYVWTPSQLVDVLGEDDARLVGAYFGVTERGNFEHGTSILHVARPAPAVARELGVDTAVLQAAVERARPTLLADRGKRVRPARDEKVLTSWNGMMLRAFAEAARVLGRPDYRAAAERNAAFLLGTMRAADGSVHRTWKPGHVGGRLNGYLEDYANLADGLVALYEATFERRWLTAAAELADRMLTQFADVQGGGFFDTAVNHEALIVRPKDLFDNATPSGNAVAADVLQRLALLLGRPDYQRAARSALLLVREIVGRAPLGFARSLSALDFHLSRPREIAVVGELDAPDTAALVQAAFTPFLPNKVVAGAAPEDAEAGAAVPLLEQRGTLDGQATAYVCEHYTCLAPVTTPQALLAQLGAA